VNGADGFYECYPFIAQFLPYSMLEFLDVGVLALIGGIKKFLIESLSQDSLLSHSLIDECL
jgi:hypothetical protein